MQDYQKLVSGVTRFDQLYGMVNAMFAVLQSQFCGPQFPANPTAGQPCFRTDMHPPRVYVYDGTDWQDSAGLSPVVADLEDEITQARGAAASLEARLDVALNQDGTLKNNTPFAAWWTTEPDAVSRFSDNQFSVEGDKRAVYVKRRAVMLEQDRDAKSWVTDAVLHNGATIVSLQDACVDTGLSGVAYGQDVGNEPSALGYRQIIAEVLSADGRLEVDITRHGIQPKEGEWFPLLQVAGAVPYRATAQNITAQGFVLRLFYPDGKPGAGVSSGIITCGSGLRCGNEVFCGQRVSVTGVKVGCMIPV